uniref:Ig-like domain-containing protein n=1 Tax=Chrysolophus pictus TaxID=9089 RepID=A0A8C3L6N2_CHRPC
MDLGWVWVGFEMDFGWVHCSGAAVTSLLCSFPELFSVPVLSLEGPQELLEGSALTLLCATHGNALRPHLSLQHLFYQDGLLVGGPQSAPQHRVPALLLSHSGSYSCQVQTETGSVQKRSAPITITVRRVPVAGVSLHSRPPDAQVLVGDRVVLSCAVAEGTGPLSFSWYRQNHTGVLGSGPLYELPVAQLGDDDHYHCTANNSINTASSPQLHVTVTLPVSNASITVLGTEVGAELVGTAGEELTLSCRVGMGTGQVGFVWLRDGQELSTGPTWHLGVLGPEHAGTYQCVATNSLGSQRVFRARSPEVLLVVTQQGWGQQRAQGEGCGDAAPGLCQPGLCHIVPSLSPSLSPVLAIRLSVFFLVLLAANAVLGWHLRLWFQLGGCHTLGSDDARHTLGTTGLSPGDTHCLLSPSFAAASKSQHRCVQHPAKPPSILRFHPLPP